MKVRAILEDLEFNPDRTFEFEDAMEQLGALLGFASARPERDEGNGPDNLWAIGPAEFLVIECKSGVTVEEIHRDTVAQLGHSMNWFDQRYPHPNTAKPVLVHPSVHLASNAVAPLHTRIIDQEGLKSLKKDVLEFSEALAAAECWQQPREIAPRLEQHNLTPVQLILGHSSLPKSS